MGNFWKKGDFFSFEKFEITLSSTYQGENYYFFKSKLLSYLTPLMMRVVLQE